MIDSRDIKELHPTLQRACNELIKRMQTKGYKVGISSTYRDKEKQDVLFNRRPKVTTLRGGKSMHNHRLAFDIFQNIKGKEWNDDKFFQTAGKIALELGIEWGGAWKSFVDKPHFQWTGEFTQAQVTAGKVPKDTKLKWEKQPTEVEDIKNLLKILDGKKKPYDKAYWDRVVKGGIKADPKFLDVLIKRSLE